MKKKEKLELFLNKVVEFNDPKAYKGKGCNFKAFLYKNSEGYYFKVVEVMAGTDLSFNDIIPLMDGDENFLVIADKPKLMTVSKKSWHYKLMKYVLRDNTPTPRDMQNGCPYFWLLAFSMLVVTFVVLFKMVKWVVMLIPRTLFFVLEQMVNSWVLGLDDEVAYDVYYGGGTSKMPKTAKIFFESKNKYGSDDEFFNFFLSKKYKDIDIDDPDYEVKRNEIQSKWKTWRDDLDEKRSKQRKIEDEKESVVRKKRWANERKREESRAKWNAKMKPMIDGFDKFGKTLERIFTVKRGRVNMVVKRTKQFVGAIVTLIILAGTFLAVNLIARGLMIGFDWCIANWVIFLGIAIAGVMIGILYLFYVLITSWGQAVISKYNRGKKVWYIEPFIYLIWLPLKYIALSIAWIVVNILWLPVKFIFYTALFKHFLRPIGLFIAKVAVSIFKGIIGSTGIFGEYFGASYSDYCPGIEWRDFDED